MVSIDSEPYATIFIDGTRIGITPLLKHALPPGRHTLRAVLEDGRTQNRTIDIPAGKHAKPIHLNW
jgi:serine/threonine-protein kinase